MFRKIGKFIYVCFCVSDGVYNTVQIQENPPGMPTNLDGVVGVECHATLGCKNQPWAFRLPYLYYFPSIVHRMKHTQYRCIEDWYPYRNSRLGVICKTFVFILTNYWNFKWILVNLQHRKSPFSWGSYSDVSSTLHMPNFNSNQHSPAFK